MREFKKTIKNVSKKEFVMEINKDKNLCRGYGCRKKIDTKNGFFCPSCQGEIDNPTNGSSERLRIRIYRVIDK